MIVRRVTQRQFLLRPDKASKGIFLYALAYFAKKRRIRITGFIVLSNHEHICIEDPHGNVSVFLTELHSVIARAMNCERGRFEHFWASERTTLCDSWALPPWSARLATPRPTPRRPTW